MRILMTFSYHGVKVIIFFFCCHFAPVSSEKKSQYPTRSTTFPIDNHLLMIWWMALFDVTREAGVFNCTRSSNYLPCCSLEKKKKQDKKKRTNQILKTKVGLLLKNKEIIFQWLYKLCYFNNRPKVVWIS